MLLPKPRFAHKPLLGPGVGPIARSEPDWRPGYGPDAHKPLFTPRYAASTAQGAHHAQR